VKGRLLNCVGHRGIEILWLSENKEMSTEAPFLYIILDIFLCIWLPSKQQ